VTTSSVLGRRSALAALAGMALSVKEAAAQVQEVTNVSSVVATGDVTLEQDAAGNITAQVGITRGPGGIQVVSNDGQVVSTGDVHITQRAAASMDVSAGGRTGVCIPGQYREVDGGLQFCDETGCWLVFYCPTGCKKGRC
jgi:hypothetical protein